MKFEGPGQWFAQAKAASKKPKEDKRSEPYLIGTPGYHGPLGLTIRKAPAEGAKLSPESVHYGPAHGQHHCGSCSMYRPEGNGKTGSCTLVAGLIEADHVCDRWAAKQRHLTPLARRQQRNNACPK